VNSGRVIKGAAISMMFQMLYLGLKILAIKADLNLPTRSVVRLFERVATSRGTQCRNYGADLSKSSWQVAQKSMM